MLDPTVLGAEYFQISARATARVIDGILDHLHRDLPVAGAANDEQRTPNVG